MADGAQAYRDLHGSIKPVARAVLENAALCAALRSHAAPRPPPVKREDGAAAGAGVKREHPAAVKREHAAASNAPAAPAAKRPKREVPKPEEFIEID